jgi:hypothetical protein
MVEIEVIVVVEPKHSGGGKNLQVLVNDIAIGSIQRCLHSFLASM